MDKFQLHYSDKNIPLHSEELFIKTLISKTENFLKRIRWKAFFFDKKVNSEIEGETESEEDTTDHKSFGFKTENNPPQNQLLSSFENDIYDLISNITFRKVDNEFQKALVKDVKKIWNSENIIVSADKSSNLYNVEVKEYQKLVKDNVTKTYKKAPSDTETKINKEAAVLVEKLDLSDRVQVHTNNECFVTFKDHKPNFYAAKQCRLINPAKTGVGRISKQILEKIVLEVKDKTQSNLWKNTQSVLQWFSNLSYGNRAKAKFVQFDIESFYPTITEELLTKALQYAQTIVKIEQTEIDIIFHSRKALLFNNAECWVKKSGKLFDVTMGAYDGAEVCELVGLYLLSKIHKIIPISYIGLYRDDGLAIIPNANGPKLDKIQKDLYKCFKEESLQITTIINLPEVDFLDVHLHLRTGSFKPYRKENNQLQYIHRDSNHPKSITKNIPEMIGKRISGLSSDKSTFEREKIPYENALKSSGYNEKLNYTPPDLNKKKQRRRKVTWFNPPFSCNVATNIGREFLRILSKNFPLKHRYHKIFNRNTVKISYSCLPNMSNIIKSHNNKVLANSSETAEAKSDAKTCNCRKPAACPLEGKCLTNSIIYQATISSNSKNPQKFRYIGLTEGAFKSRYNGHLQSIRHEKHEAATELSKKYWELKRGGNEPSIVWKIVKKVETYKGGQLVCNLCLAEKYFIIRDRGKNLLNSRTELLSKCRHRKKFLLNRALS